MPYALDPEFDISDDRVLMTGIATVLRLNNLEKGGDGSVPEEEMYRAWKKYRGSLQDSDELKDILIDAHLGSELYCALVAPMVVKVH